MQQKLLPESSPQNSWINRKTDINKIAEETVKPKPVANANSRNVEKIVIQPEEGTKY